MNARLSGLALATVLATTVAACSPNDGSDKDLSAASSASTTGDGDGNGTDGNGTDGNGTDGNGNDGNGNDGNGNDGNGDGGGGRTTSNQVLIGSSFQGGDDAPWDFGRVVLGDWVTGTLTVRGSPVVPGAVTVSLAGDSAFVLDKNGCAGFVFPGPACAVTIIAAPEEAGDHDGEVLIRVGSVSTLVAVVVHGEAQSSDENPDTGPPATPDASESDSNGTTPSEDSDQTAPSEDFDQTAPSEYSGQTAPSENSDQTAPSEDSDGTPP